MTNYRSQLISKIDAITKLENSGYGIVRENKRSIPLEIVSYLSNVCIVMFFVSFFAVLYELYGVALGFIPATDGSLLAVFIRGAFNLF